MRLVLPTLLLLFLAETLVAQVDVIGHRGWRGQYPENTVIGFLAALELGVDVLEMDIVLSADGHPIVSHEPWMHPHLCLDPQGKSLKRRRKVNLFTLTREDITRYNCGSLIQRAFPSQQNLPAYKPALAEVLEACETWLQAHPGLPPFGYSIEIKRKPGWEGRYVPALPEYIDPILEVIRVAGIQKRCVLQSFDPEVLIYLREKAPEIPLSLLVRKGRLDQHLARLPFQPDIYSPHFSRLDAGQMKMARARGILVMPWTVNNHADIRQMLHLGVDAIITDYPERVLELLQRL